MTTRLTALFDLFRTHPVRTSVLSVVPVLVAGAQGLNALVHGLRSPLVGAFVLGLLAFAIGATSHSLATFRIECLEGHERHQ